MMKKLFFKLSMLLFVLAMSTNVAWANLGDLPAEAMEYLNNPIYKAQLTGRTSSTGGGKVYVTKTDEEPDYSTYEEGTSNVSVSGLAVTMQGMDVAQVPFWCWAKADDGYFFAGYSFSNGGVDLAGIESSEVEFMDESKAYKYVRKFDTSADKESVEYYTIYGTFEPVRISAYALSGSNSFSSGTTCSQTITFTLSGNDIDQSDFNTAAITESKGGGSWTSPDDDAWSTSDLMIDGNTATLVVKFTAPDESAAEYSANLQLKTKGNIAINVPLNARRIVAGVQAIRYNKSKVQQEAGDLATLLTNADADDIIKLNGNYSSAVAINKNLTFDLNGFELSNTFTVSGGDVTLAYSPYGGTISGAVSITEGNKLILTGGTITGNVNVSAGATLEQNGATITGEVTNNGTMTTTDGVHTGPLYSFGSLTINGGTFTTSGVPVSVTKGTATIQKGHITSTASYAVQTGAQGTTVIEKLAIIEGADHDLYCIDGGSLTVNNGKFTDPYKLNEGTIVFNSAYFRTNASEMATVGGKQLWRNTAGAEYREGYEYFAGDYELAVAAGVSICRIGAVSYGSLEDALAFANNTSDKVAIIMQNDYVLPAGYYTLPANATLIIPMSDEQGSETQMVEHDRSYEIPTKFRKLTLSEGVNWNVYGTIEVSGKQLTSDDNHTGSTSGPYGQLQLNSGSKIVLQNGSLFRAWGYVTGDIANQDAQHNVPSGEIDARRGSTVRELFQMGDWKGGAFSGSGLIAGDSIFPLTTYFMQNIEVPVKYHPGSSLTASTTVSAANAITMSANDIQIVGKTGDVAMFLMDEMADAENTWVRKWYDASKDQQVYEINSGAHVGSLVIPLVSSPLLPMVSDLSLSEGGQTIGQMLANMTGSSEPVVLPENLIMNSGQYFLPITSNFKLHLLSGEMDFTQSTELLPGSEVEIDKEAKVLVSADDPDDDVKGGSLFIYDIRDWGNYADGEPTQIVNYSPVFDGQPDTRGEMKSASLNVHGAFDTRGGYVYTTEHGANIHSSLEDAGTFMFTLAAKPADYSEEIVQKASGREAVACYSAWLNNRPDLAEPAEADYVKTGGNAAAGDSYCYVDLDGTGGKWAKLQMDGCFMHDGASDIYYAKPQEYVALANGKVANADHTYSDAAGAGRLFILMEEQCQWWEVEAKDNLFHCIHPENDTYYYWDEDDEVWKEKRFTITWKNYDGSVIESKKYDPDEGTEVVVPYNVTYGTMAEYLGSAPTRPADDDYTYDFNGWSPELGPVTSDVTYTATYVKKQIKYTVIFVQDGGVEIERHLLARDEVPVCENVPTRTGYILQWEPSIEPVVGNQTYTATWLPEPPAQYSIIFKNYNGDTLQGGVPAYMVDAEAMPVYSGATPTKQATSEYEYVFAGWKPALAPATTNATYVAQYSENAKTYEIKFYDENGTSVLKSENLGWGATPTPPVVSKTKTGYTYTYVWQNKDDASKTIESVKGAANYKPVFTETPNKYTVTLQCNVDGACSFTGVGIYDYNTSVNPTATIKDPTAYEFVEWTGNSHSFGARNVTSDITLSVLVKVKNVVLPNLPVGIEGTETIADATDYANVTLTSDGLEQSGQIINANNITLYGNADFILQQSIKAGKWYSIAVPWRVNANGGVYLGDAATPATLGPDFEVIYYDGAVRATQGPGTHCWVYMKNLGSSQKVLEPGRAYMIYLKKNDVSKITFRKTAKANLLTTETSVNEYPETTNNDGKDANWNAIANPALYHAYINAGSTDAKAQHYLADEGRYDWFVLSAHQLVVGEPIYVQAPSDKSIVANGASYAPRRANAEPNTTYDVKITVAGASKYADHLSIQINEDKEADKYTIGQDLVKFGVSSKVAQMWINRYDAKLCANTMVSGEESTSFPMTIFAPKEGDYTIAIEREVAAEDYALYLTYNGEAIWNLSEGAYTANLNKGTDANYGLRISVKKAPAVVTGIDEAIVDSKDDAATKVLINGQVFIIRGERVYSIDGQLVK